MKKYAVIIEQDENKVFVAHVPTLPGCHTEGDTLDEVLENIKEAIGLYVEYKKEVQDPMKFIAVKTVSASVS